MFFKFKRPKTPFKRALSTAKPLKVKKMKKSVTTTTTTVSTAATKTSLSLKRFRWPSLRHKTHRGPTSTVATTISPVRRRQSPAAHLPSPALTYRPPSRIRCGTTVIPLMRASRARQAVATKRPATSPERQLSKTPRLAATREHYNPIYDEVYNESDEYLSMDDEDDDCVYEDMWMPKKKRTMPFQTQESLDLMQVSAMPDNGSLWRTFNHNNQPERNSSDENDVYALHGGDWISISAASGIYDEVVSTSVSSVCSDSEEEDEVDNHLDGAIYGWMPIAPPRQISWHSTAAYSTKEHYNNNAPAHHHSTWLHRESYIMEP